MRAIGGIISALPLERESTILSSIPKPSTGQPQERVVRLRFEWVYHAEGSCEDGVTDVANTATEESKKLQNDTVTKLRALSHDLSNYIETIMQASYLLAQAKLDENNKKWLEMVDKASQDAARVNREIREILRSQS